MQTRTGPSLVRPILLCNSGLYNCATVAGFRGAWARAMQGIGRVPYYARALLPGGRLNRMRIVLPVLAALAMVPAAEAQNTLQGKIQWGGVNKSFVWYWKDSKGTVFGAYGGGAYGAEPAVNSTGSAHSLPNPRTP